GRSPLVHLTRDKHVHGQILDWEELSRPCDYRDLACETRSRRKNPAEAVSVIGPFVAIGPFLAIGPFGVRARALRGARFTATGSPRWCAARVRVLPRRVQRVEIGL